MSAEPQTDAPGTVKTIQIAKGDYPYEYHTVRYGPNGSGGWVWDRGNGWEPLAWGGSEATARQLICKEADARY